LAALNDHLRQCCVTARERTCGGNAETVGGRFARDLAAARPVPARPFEACVVGPGSVDKYQTVAFDGNRYTVLQAKPATLDHAPVYRDWVLPRAFVDLCRDLGTRFGVRAGVRQDIRVLQLLARHPLDRVERAVHLVRVRGDPTAAAIAASAERLAGQPPSADDTQMSLAPSALPDLSRFNRLLRSHTPEENPDE
jgi:hypothetical protein